MTIPPYVGGTVELFPSMPYADWTGTRETLHRFAQVVGKIRLAASPRRNHWWNVPFHLTGRGITTRPMGLTDQGDFFCVDFDFTDHRLVVTGGAGSEASFPLHGLSVAAFFGRLTDALAQVGVDVRVERPYPFDLPDARRPFAEDEEHCTYDPAAAHRYWVVLSQVNLVLEEYAARWAGKTSPVHHFWHTFDIAVTRFSDTVVAHPPEVDAVTREAYSREVISAGFWFGDPDYPEPAFYSYTAPEPAGLATWPLRPEAAFWQARKSGSHLAVLPYERVRAAASLRGEVLAFYESAFLAGAGAAGWSLAVDSCPDGITDVVAG